jgi:protein-tyrosine phosphatase
MAEFLARSLYAGVEFSSAGLMAQAAQPANAAAKAVMAEIGLSLETHLARQVNESMLRKADTALTMTKEHCLRLRALYPAWADKIARLGDAAGDGRDVPDPWGGDLSEYRDCRRQICEMLERMTTWHE